MKWLYDYQDYRRYLIEALGGEGKRTGQRGALAVHIGCQTAYLSQVLGGSANLSLEQAFSANEFLNHDETAGEFFMLLVQKDRAGTIALKNHFQQKIDVILDRRNEIKARMPRSSNISATDQAIYYSQWYILAIHVALTIPTLQTVAALAKHFHLPESLVRETLDFLATSGLAHVARGRYTIGTNHVHLPKDSKFFRQLHTNWRLEAVRALERRRPTDVHYSVVYSLSRADAEKIRRLILKYIEQNMEIVRPSKEEVLYCSTMDFFEVAD